jgi:hypothetical protein
MTTDPVRDGRRYRRLIKGVFAVGIASLFAATAVDRPLPGLVVYAAAVVGGVGMTFYLKYGSPVVLQDERDAALERQASHVVFQLFGYAGLFGFVALFLLDAVGRSALSSTAETLLYAYAAIFLTWGGVYLALRYGS